MRRAAVFLVALVCIPPTAAHAAVDRLRHLSVQVGAEAARSSCNCARTALKRKKDLRRASATDTVIVAQSRRRAVR
jgi:hypothetical protein